jgi:hypothetical protein
MSPLRDTFRDDVLTVFQNPEEFAAAHTIEFQGVTINAVCVLDEEFTSPGNIGTFEGILKLSRIMFIKETLLPTKPIPGARMRIDGTWYDVTFAEPDNFGMTEIHLERRQT